MQPLLRCLRIGLFINLYVYPKLTIVIISQFERNIFFLRWRKFSHLEPSYLYTSTEGVTPSPDSLAGISTHTSRANSQDRFRSFDYSFLSECDPDFSSLTSRPRKLSHILSTTSTLNHSSRRLYLCQVTEHLINTKRRKSCMPTLTNNLTRQKSAPYT